MTYLILGLVLFLGAHSVRIVADDWRSRMRARLGEGVWKGLYSLLALAGLALIVWGFGLAREQPVVLWMPPTGMRHLAALLTLIAFVLFAAAYVPGNHFKARLHHPMAAGVKVWALAHLLSNGMLVHQIVFGAFLLWGVAVFAAARRRDRLAGTVYAPGQVLPTVVTVALGAAAWAAVAFWLHGMLIGIRPLI
jgi:uncharacterized membrane protein